MTATVQKPLLLFFHSPTQGRTRRVEGFVAQVLQRRRNHDAFRLTRIDVGERPDLAERFRVSASPALVVVAENRVRVRLVDPAACSEIYESLAPWLRSQSYPPLIAEITSTRDAPAIDESRPARSPST